MPVGLAGPRRSSFSGRGPVGGTYEGCCELEELPQRIHGAPPPLRGTAQRNGTYTPLTGIPVYHVLSILECLFAYIRPPLSCASSPEALVLFRAVIVRDRGMVPLEQCRQRGESRHQLDYLRQQFLRAFASLPGGVARSQGDRGAYALFTRITVSL